MKVFWLVVVFLLSFVRADMQMDKDIYDYYQKWKPSYLVAEKGGEYRIATDKKDKHRTVSEGQGYGMLITVLMQEDRDAQDIFDGLWKFSRSHPSWIAKDLMSFEVPEKKDAVDSAFDGDADIAYALILADKRWGSKGKVNYKKEAKKVLDAIWKYTIGKNSFLPLLGDWVDPKGKKYNQFTTRTSDFMLDNFKAFYKFTGDKKWLKVVYVTQHALLDVQNHKTGLVPDFIKYNFKTKRFVPVKDGFLENHDSSYYYNACRVPFRIGVDALVHKDTLSKKIAQRLSNWSKISSNNNPLNIKSGFELDGKVIGDYFSIVFTAPLGVAAMSDDRRWAKKIYDEVKSRYENYYEDSVSLLSMLVMSGDFIDPTKMVR
jgi:endo-1,4-beta-D-glucanase Y